MNYLSASCMALLLMGASCSGVEKSEAVTADVVAAQMEGRRAARDIVAKEWNDTVKLQEALLDARAKRVRYDKENRAECAAAFDSGFISTVRAVRPELSRELERRAAR